MARINSFTELTIWKLGMEVSKLVYLATKNFPADERFGLVAQIRRAAVSLPTNVAEGWGRNTPGEFRQFLGIALGSAAEVQTELYLSRDLEFLSAADCESIRAKVEHFRAATLKLKSTLK